MTADTGGKLTRSSATAERASASILVVVVVFYWQKCGRKDKANLHNKRKREQISHNSTKSNCGYDKQGLHLHSTVYGTKGIWIW